jgi:hypothetical protein
MKIENQKDFGRMMFIVFGAFFAILGWQYESGPGRKCTPAISRRYWASSSSFWVWSYRRALHWEEKRKGIQFDGLRWFYPDRLFRLAFCSGPRPILSLFILIAISAMEARNFMKSCLNATVLILMCLAICVGTRTSASLWPSFRP